MVLQACCSLFGSASKKRAIGEALILAAQPSVESELSSTCDSPLSNASDSTCIASDAELDDFQLDDVELDDFQLDDAELDDLTAELEDLELPDFDSGLMTGNAIDALGDFPSNNLDWLIDMAW